MGRLNKRQKQLKEAKAQKKSNKKTKTPKTIPKTSKDKFLPKGYRQVRHGTSGGGGTFRIKPPNIVITNIDKYLKYLKDKSICAEFRKRFLYYDNHFAYDKKVLLFVAACDGISNPTLQQLQDADIINTTDDHGDAKSLKTNTATTAFGKRKRIQLPNIASLASPTHIPGATTSTAGTGGAAASPRDNIVKKQHGVQGGGGGTKRKKEVGPTSFYSTTDTSDRLMRTAFKHARRCKGKGNGNPQVVDLKTKRQGGCCAQVVKCMRCNQILGTIRSEKAIIYPYPDGHSRFNETKVKPFAASRYIVVNILQNISSRAYSKASTNGSSFNSNTYQTWVDLIHRHVVYLNHNIRQLVWELEVLWMIKNNTVKLVTIIDSKYDQEEPVGRHCVHAVVAHRSGLILYSAKASMTQRQRGFNRNPFENDPETNKLYETQCKHMDPNGTYSGTANSLDWITGQAAVKKLFECGLTPQMIMDCKCGVSIVFGCIFFDKFLFYFVFDCQS
tara:strand:- start:2186 stop:3688 length:1503 start_codon:yes stop_codon:yes gene_type:complete